MIRTLLEILTDLLVSLGHLLRFFRLLGNCYRILCS
jgi:hypothetical protein